MATDLIMLRFDDTYGAQKAMAGVRALQELNYAWLDDVAIVEKHNSGRVVTHTTHGSVSAGAWMGGLIGMLIGFLWPPLLFLAWFGIGAGMGAIIEKATKETGLPKDLLVKIKNELSNGTSALLLIGATGDADQMAHAFEQYHPTSVVREALSDETVDKMKATLEQHDVEEQPVPADGDTSNS